MNYQDGLDILVEVAEYIKNLGRTDVGFVCVGSGPELPGLRHMVKDRNLTDTVNFTGRVPDADLLAALSTADVCVNPDRPCEMNNISTMIKIVEYMALGKRIVQFESKQGKFSAQDTSLYADRLDPIRALPRRFSGCWIGPKNERGWASSAGGGGTGTCLGALRPTPPRGVRSGFKPAGRAGGSEPISEREDGSAAPG